VKWNGTAFTGTHRISCPAAPGDVGSLPRSFRLLSDGLLLHASLLLPTTPCQKGLVIEAQHQRPIRRVLLRRTLATGRPSSSFCAAIMVAFTCHNRDDDEHASIMVCHGLLVSFRRPVSRNLLGVPFMCVQCSSTGAVCGKPMTIPSTILATIQLLQRRVGCERWSVFTLICRSRPCQNCPPPTHRTHIFGFARQRRRNHRPNPRNDERSPPPSL
jgi:hypothetical protein